MLYVNYTSIKKEIKSGKNQVTLMIDYDCVKIKYQPYYAIVSQLLDIKINQNRSMFFCQEEIFKAGFPCSFFFKFYFIYFFIKQVLISYPFYTYVNPMQFLMQAPCVCLFFYLGLKLYYDFLVQSKSEVIFCSSVFSTTNM